MIVLHHLSRVPGSCSPCERCEGDRRVKYFIAVDEVRNNSANPICDGCRVLDFSCGIVSHAVNFLSPNFSGSNEGLARVNLA